MRQLMFSQKSTRQLNTYGGSLLSRIPTASNSASSRARCSARFVASRTIRIRSLVYDDNEVRPGTSPDQIHEIKRNTNLCSGDDLSSSTLPLSGTFNDTWKIEDLDLRTSILQHTRDGRQRGEGVGGNLALRLGDLRQKRRFSYRGKTDESDTRITTLADVKSCAATGARARLGFQKLCS